MAVTVLIVDDSAAARVAIGHQLRAAGCSVVGEAVNAADALTLFRQLKPRIVCLDLIMPIKQNVDGLTLVRTIKKEAPATVIIVISVLSSDKMRQELISEGVLAYIPKPITDYTMDGIRVQLKRIFPELAGAQSAH